ncbi:endoglucanase 25-like [Hibiscus syriacus]|uniref:Endoglucanase 25-like n=1 Tax=Hibiscus syriacus TaxID=106335 RepID=A0A6A3AX93_HIBSY|nr:endoglucanase 25-like [Hibiscus syriacus]
MKTRNAACGHQSWSVSDDSLRRYVQYASESCIQELLMSASVPVSSVSEPNKLGNGGDGWKILTLEKGVEISKRRSGSLHILRSRWVLRSVSPQQFITVANAIDAAKKWDSELLEAKYIKDLEDNLSIIRLRFGDTLVEAVASLPKEIAAGLLPQQNNAIRGLLMQSGWVVEKLEDINSCIVTYVVQLDPAGCLPKWCTNRLNTKLVMIIENLSKLVQTTAPHSA